MFNVRMTKEDHVKSTEKRYLFAMRIETERTDFLPQLVSLYVQLSVSTAVKKYCSLHLCEMQFLHARILK